MSRNQGPKVSGAQTKLWGSLAPSNKLPFLCLCVRMCLRVWYVYVRVCNMCVSVPCVSMCVLTCCAQPGASVNSHTHKHSSATTWKFYTVHTYKGVCVLYILYIVCVCIDYRAAQSKAMFSFVLNKFKTKFKCIESDCLATAVQRLARESYAQLSLCGAVLSSTSHQYATLSPL